MKVSAVSLTFCIALAGFTPVRAQQSGPERAPDPNSSENQISPIRRIDHVPNRGDRRRGPQHPAELRSYDGTGNNLGDPEMGAAFTNLVRWIDVDYGDGILTLAGAHRPSPRAISNAVAAQDGDMANELLASDFLWQWGQFLDHDLDLTDGADPAEPADIAVPTGDAWFDPFATGTATIAFNRSLWDDSTGTDAGNPRQQVNEITAWIDASNVYGSEASRAAALRMLDGSGSMKTSDGDLLPFNVDGLPNAGGSSPTLFIAGDVRANEQVGLTALHTLFVREHNRLADRIAQRHPDWDGDQIFEKARQLVGAEMQIITYREYLPALLGAGALPPYRGYRPSVDARISNMFSAASYRYGHSALSSTLLRIDASGNEISDGHLALRDAFFNPSRIIDEGGIEPLLRGLAVQACQTVDPFLVDDVRNFLFGPPGSGGFDLASLNIQRGRDHGLPSYNDARVELGLSRAVSFADISSNAAIQMRLASVYDSVDDIDLWVGALAEDRVGDSHLGQLNQLVISRQFEVLRDGDRFWHERTLNGDDRDLMGQVTLATIIRRNTSIGAEISNNVFRVGPGGGRGPRDPGNGSGDDPPNGGRPQTPN